MITFCKPVYPREKSWAIQTFYRGFWFRSRTEVRWAVFFDSLGMRWRYEPEGCEGSFRYLPDFWCPAYPLSAEAARRLTIKEEWRRAPHIPRPMFPLARYQHERGYFIEVKPNGRPLPIEISKAVGISSATGHRVLFLCGVPGDCTILTLRGTARRPTDELQHWWGDYGFCSVQERDELALYSLVHEILKTDVTFEFPSRHDIDRAISASRAWRA